MIPSLVYMVVYYVVFLHFIHFHPEIDISVLQVPFRISVIFLTLSLLIYVVSDTIALRKIKRQYIDEIEEKFNGKYL
jgi:succinate dehydrogenase hydrophobic anchor subunit